jgi:phenylpropionate dioxygenase-like ring-hydroxylating dioxygenase large terminal subunit
MEGRMPVKKPAFITEPYSGYYHNDVPEDDKELTRVGPGTPAGNYLRRFWHPVAYTQQLTELPLAIKIMCEELVLFRSHSGRIGLLELHCSHRGTSLEFGLIEESGIRCCYHGWLFDTDGRILDTPGEPPDSTYKERLCHGAYPVTEYNGIIFAYMGPPGKMPPFPMLDVYETAGYHLEPGEEGAIPNHKPCNWLQLADNLVDPLHEDFLHATISGLQFLDRNGRLVEELAILGEGEFLDTPTGILTQEMRRVNENTVWVRNIEFNWPNFATLGFPPVLPHEWGPDQKELHDPPMLIFWVVPVDDHNAMEITYVRTPDEGHNPRLNEPSKALEGNRGGRIYEEMQRYPGDYEAQIGQRDIAVHSLEHLGVTDRGVIMMRQGLRSRIQMVQQGQDPPELQALHSGNTVHTHSGDTLLNVPSASTPEEDNKLIAKLGRNLGKRYLDDPPHLSDIHM